MEPKIVVVEDDHLQVEPLRGALEREFPGADVSTVSTEHGFRSRFSELAAHPPDLVVMDMMLRWATPAPNSPVPPQDVEDGGYFRAGLRCATLLSDDFRLAHVPVVLYTILERSDLERDGMRLPHNCTWVGKSSDLQVLLRHVRALIHRPDR